MKAEPAVAGESVRKDRVPLRDEERRIGTLLRRTAGRVAAVPPALWVPLIVVFSTVQLVTFGRSIEAPWIVPDELFYSEMARSFAATGEFAIRDVVMVPYGVVYPLLIAPAYALDELTVAYGAAKVVNALLTSSAAVPAFFLARRVLRPGLAVIAAAFAVLVPSTLYSGMLMTENAFYPVFVLFALALVSMLETPSTTRQLLALAALVLACLTRVQGVVLVPAVLTAVVLVVVLDARAAGEAATRRALARRMAAYRVALAGVALLVAAPISATLMRGESPLTLLGAYEGAARRYSFGDVPRWLTYHLAEVNLYLGVIPFAAALVVGALAFRRNEARALRVFAVASLAVVLWMTIFVAAFATRASSFLHGRNLFYLAPLFVTLFLVWIDRGMPRPRRLVSAAAIVGAMLPAALPIERLGYNARFEALGVLPWTTTGLSEPRLAATVFATLLVALFLAVPRRAAAVLPVFLFLNFTVIREIAKIQMEAAADWTRTSGVTLERDWIDRTVGPRARVDVLWDATPTSTSGPLASLGARRRTVWVNEFFNQSVRRVYHLGAGMIYALPYTPVSVAPGGVLRDSAGRPVRSAYVLAHGGSGVDGEIVRRDPRTSMTLYRVAGPVRVSPTTQPG